MNISKIFSNSLQKNININKKILDMINPSKANENRRLSVFQRIRKKSLQSISNKDQSINENIINSSNKILNLDIKNIIDYINYDLTSGFQNIFPTKKILVNNKFLNPTKITKEILNMFTDEIYEKFSIIIHGSQADGLVTKYSDIDISIFLKQKELTSIEKLYEVIFYIEAINKKINYYDPVSHHSVFLNLEKDLSCYAESFMPINVLEKGVSPKNQKLNFVGVRNDLDLKIESFFNILINLIKLDNDQKLNNPYSLKQLISGYFMLIILEFEIIQNQYLDKKKIFDEEIQKYKTNKELEIFNKASLIRQKWPDLPFSNLGISTEFIKSIISDMINMSENIQNIKIIEKVSDLYLS